MKKRMLRSVLALCCALAMLLSDAGVFFPQFTLSTAFAVTQEEIDQLKDEQNALKSEKNALKSELNSIQRDKSNAVARKQNLDTQIAVTTREIANAETLIAQYEELIEQTAQELAETRLQEVEQRKLFRARVRSMEERGTVSFWSVLFHSASFSDLLAAMDFLNEIMESDQRVVDKLKALGEEMAALQASYESALAEQKEQKEILAARNQELNEALAEAQSTIAELAEDEAAYKKLIAEKEAAEAEQRKEIDRLSRELAAQQNQTKTYPGGYIWPVPSHYVTSPLGSRYTGIPGASTNHAGIDIGRVGYTTQVVASKAGTVIVSSYNQYRGNYVVVSHGPGNTTTYQHLSKRSVNVGDKVAQGQVLGITGSTGVSRGAHLHFEITENSVIIDPLKYLTDYEKGWSG